MHLSTDRILIRNFKTADLSDFHHYRSDPEVTRYQSFTVMNLHQASEFIARMKERDFGTPGEWVQYGIIDKSSQKLIGDCAVHIDLNESRIGEIGITIAPEAQNKGYAKEAFTALLKYLFDVKNFHRIVETVDAENVASINLLKSMGFREEGHFIENIFFNGKWGSEFQYALLKREWDKRNAKSL